MEASKVTVNGKTFDLNYLNKTKKTNLRRKLIIEYIQSKPAGEYIKMDEFKDICYFSTYANTWSFVKRMVRDGVIQQHEGEKKKAFYYSVIGAVRVSTPKQVLAQLPQLEPVIPTQLNNNPDINSFIADMQKLGVEFSITISNKVGGGLKMILQEAIKTVYGMTCENVYVDLNGVIRPHKNPTPGLYYFDGQIFYRRNLQLDTYRLRELVGKRFNGRTT